MITADPDRAQLMARLYARIVADGNLRRTLNWLEPHLPCAACGGTLIWGRCHDCDPDVEDHAPPWPYPEPPE